MRVIVVAIAVFLGALILETSEETGITNDAAVADAAQAKSAPAKKRSKTVAKTRIKPAKLTRRDGPKPLPPNIGPGIGTGL